MGKSDGNKARRGPRREKEVANQFSVMADDADDDWYEEPEFDIGELASTLLPSGPHKQSARRRVDRFLEQRRLDMDLRDMFDEDDDERRERRNRQRRRQRARRKLLSNA